MISQPSVEPRSPASAASAVTAAPVPAVPAAGWWPGSAVVRLLALGGTAAAASAVVVIGLLHVLAQTGVSPVTRTISEYQLGPYAWVFDIGVIALAIGSLAVLAALIGRGLARFASASTLLVGVWIVGLVMVVVFEKTNWALGPSGGGYVHRVASIVAFLSLPIGVIALTRRWRPDARWRASAWTAFSLAVASLACFAPFVIALVLSPMTGVQWWQAVPLGVVERALALCEVATVIALGVWAARAANQPRAATMAPAANRPRAARRAEPT